MIRSALAALLVLAPVLAVAEPLVFEADDGARFIRCTDLFGTASCEVLLDAGAPYYECVALDASGDPLAAATAMVGIPVTFNQLDAALVAEVVCRPL